MWFTGIDQFTMKEIRDVYIGGNMGRLIHKELLITLGEKENSLVATETAELVNENHLKYGGSPLGFYYKSELFAVSATYKQIGISPIAPELEDKAQYLKDNRTDIPQYMTYMAHFLTQLSNLANNPVEYVANMPDQLSTFSHSLKVFENFIEANDPVGKTKLKYSRDDSKKSNFFLHYDRVNEPLKRFLFRRITT